MTLLAVLAIAACEKEPATEWERLDDAIRTYGDFDAAIGPSLLTQGVAVPCEYYIEGIDLSEYEGWFIPRVAWIFSSDGTVRTCERATLPRPDYVVESTWKYDAMSRTISYGATELVVKAVVSDTELIFQEAGDWLHGDGTHFVLNSRTVVHLLTDAESIARYEEMFASLGSVVE